MEKIFINGEIGAWNARSEKNELFYKGGVPLAVYIDSPGGSVTDGNAIAALLRNHATEYGVEVKTIGMGMVASIATMVLLSGTRVELDPDAFLMIHNPFAAYVSGGSKDLRQLASVLDTMKEVMANRYVSQIEKNGKLMDGDRQKTKNTVLQYMANETWFSAQEALDFGLIDAIATYQEDKETMQNLTASLTNTSIEYKMVAQCTNVPTQIKNSFKMETPNNTEEKVSLSFVAKLLALMGFKPKAEAVEAEAVAPAQIEAPAPVVETPAPVAEAPKAVELTPEQMVEALTKSGYKVEKAETLDAKLAQLEAQAKEASDKLKALEEENAKFKAQTPVTSTEPTKNGKQKAQLSPEILAAFAKGIK